ncbi:MAG: sulfate ABC transporter substrate-binding protein [Verrucomicrobiae bacterium]|nr:sulfate ABC transporter substrate-binding protein [Verrucomicrobiae bacterium]
MAIAAPKSVELLNVSYDPTRELFEEFNRAFSAHWKATTGDSVSIRMSHGGSGKQARAVIDGLAADVVTLALAADVDAIAERSRQISPGWQRRLPDNSAPYTSTVVFLVRKGNPKGIGDWEDLVQPGVSVITANPKSSGGARWNYLAAWGAAARRFGGDTNQVFKFMTALFEHVPVLDTGARGATTTFTQRGIGDVLITWENEAFLSLAESGGDSLEMVVPPLSILAEPTVAIVESAARKRGTEQVATEYLKYLYSEEGQEIIAKNHYRPRLESVAARYAGKFPAIEFLTIDHDFGGWSRAQKDHFGDGGTFERVQTAGRRR